MSFLKKPSPLLVLLLILIFEVNVLTPAEITSHKIRELSSMAVELVAENIGPLAPGIVKPGECLTIYSRVDLGSITGVYAWMISEVEDSLVLYNYTLGARRINNGVFEICTPRDIVSGLYDVVITTSREYILPRSLWVISETPRKLRIAVFSDLHIQSGTPTPREGDINRVAASVITHWVNPDLIIWAGDITDKSSEYESQIAQVYRYIYLYKYPVLSVPGNHDWPGGAYTSYLGPLRWIRVIGEKLLVIGIFTVPYAGFEGVAPPWEIEFLEEALANYSHIPLKIVVFHYPMFYYQGELTTRYDDEEVLKPYEPGVDTPVSSYWSPNMTAFRYVLKLIEDYNVTAVISGHIHRDLFVKYTSTRTNTITYFMTFTSTAHGVRLYNGIGLFDLDLETGEISFPVQVPGFTGFNNITPPSANNSLPIGVSPGSSITPMRTFHAIMGYKVILENRYPLYNNLSTRLLWVFPWISTREQVVMSTNSTGNATISLLDKLVVRDKLFTLIDLKLPYDSRAEIALYTVKDTSPPLISLVKVIPETPTLNRTLTLYFNVYDSEWGVNTEAIIVEFNGTSFNMQVIRPISYIDIHNNCTLTLTLTMRSTNTTITFLKVKIIDLSGKVTEKLYQVVFYPPGVSPTEPPVSEIVVEEELTPTPTPTPYMITDTFTEPPSSPAPQYLAEPAVVVVISAIIIIAILASLYLLKARK